MAAPNLAIGTSLDVHRFKDGGPLVLGGVKLPFSKGMVAHSDGDVLMHAVLDAVLSAADLPDLGELFPDRYRGCHVPPRGPPNPHHTPTLR